jgi:hypothetical protein
MVVSLDDWGCRATHDWRLDDDAQLSQKISARLHQDLLPSPAQPASPTIILTRRSKKFRLSKPTSLKSHWIRAPYAVDQSSSGRLIAQRLSRMLPLTN